MTKEEFDKALDFAIAALVCTLFTAACAIVIVMVFG